MAELNLHALAQKVLHESTSPDPSIMAQELVALIPAEDYRSALECLARGFMRQAIHSQRSARNGGEPTPPVASRKVGQAREAWQRLLDTPEFLPSIGQWVFLKDATRTQVLEMATMRQQKSEELAAAADRYRRLAAFMQTSGAARVSDLGETTLVEALKPMEAAA